MGIKLPLTDKLLAESVFKAFIINAIATSTIAIIIVVVDSYTQELHEKYNWSINRALTRFIGFLISLFIAFLVYLLLWVVIGFGGGQLSAIKEPPKLMVEYV